MSESAWQLSLGFLGSKPILIEPGQDQLTSDAGLLPIRQFDELLGLTGRFAAALDDPRQLAFVDHMARSKNIATFRLSKPAENQSKNVLAALHYFWNGPYLRGNDAISHLRHPGRLRRSERPRRIAFRPHVQADRGSQAFGR